MQLKPLLDFGYICPAGSLSINLLLNTATNHFGALCFPFKHEHKNQPNKKRFGAFSGTSIEQIAISYVKEQDTRATLVPMFPKKATLFGLSAPENRRVFASN